VVTRRCANVFIAPHPRTFSRHHTPLQALTTFLSRVPPAEMDSMRFPCEPPEFFGCVRRRGARVAPRHPHAVSPHARAAPVAPHRPARTRTVPHPPTYPCSCRVLRARKFDVDDALKLVADTAAWRAANGVERIASKSALELLGCLEDELLFHYPKGYFPDADAAGRPVYWERVGHIDVDAMMALTTLEQLLRYHVWTYERNVRPRFVTCSAAVGRPITTLVTVLDLEGVTLGSLNSAALSFLGQATKVASAYYPETMERMLLVNAPGVFTTIWRMITPLLDARTVGKIEIIGSEAKWKARLTELVGRDHLPTQWGGALAVPDAALCPVRCVVREKSRRVGDGRLGDVVVVVPLSCASSALATPPLPAVFLRPSTCSRTRCTHLHSGRACRDVIALPPGATVRIKWYARPGDMKCAVTFYPCADGQPPAGVISGAGVAHPEPARWCLPQTEAPPAALTAALAPLAAGAVTVHALQAHPGCDKAPVVVTHTASTPGFYLVTYNNTAGWRQRELFHRCVPGRPRAEMGWGGGCCAAAGV
jgi:hypothetical protein